MRFAVLMKQVPAALSAPLQQDYTLDRKRTENITNPADVSALNLAMARGRETGAQVICLTMGPESAAQCLREGALAGADELYHICDAGIAGADTYVTAKVLAAALRQLGPVDVVFCGRHSVDGETGQVGPEIAALLGYSCLSEVVDVLTLTPPTLTLRTQTGNSAEEYRLRLPAVLCVSECKAVPALPSLRALRRANEMQIKTLTLAQLGLAGLSGRRASPTRVIAVRRKEHSRRKTVWLGENAAQTLAALLKTSGEKHNG